jgi:uncharacterized protein
MGDFLKRNINTIFVMLGNGCNMNCRYCLQHPLVEKSLCGHINPDVYRFIEQVAEENDEKTGLGLHFYGGEPLIYFPLMKEIIKKTKDLKNVHYSTISNGKAITNEMVDLFNKLNLSVCISWDGCNVEKTRGYDVFAKGSKTRELLLKLDHLGVSCVLSAYNYPQDACDAFQELSKDYFGIHGYPLSFNYDTIMDTGLGDKSLLNMDYERVKNEVAAMMDRYLAYRIKDGEMKFAELAFIESRFNSLYDYMKDGDFWNRQWCACNNGYSTLNLDLAGNLYPCHNTSQKAGSIYDPYFKYLNEVLKTDRTFERRTECLKCPAAVSCKGGCKLVAPENMENGLCKLRRAIFEPIVTATEALGRKITEAGNG